MSNVINQNFEYKALEADIERLSKEIAEKKKFLEYKDLSHKEIIKQALQPAIQQIVVQTQTATGQPSMIQSEILPDYVQNYSPDVKIQVEKLVDMVFHQGIEKTVKVAGQLNAFILDAFHDALTDKLHEELKKRNII